MKKILLVLFLIKTIIINGQSPQTINYQGVARDAGGHPVINQNINIRLSILDGSITGLSVYSETHNLTTNNSGLFNLAFQKCY